MFYLKAFAATMLALLLATYALQEAARPIFGPMVQDASDNIKALDEGAIPIAPGQLDPVPPPPPGWND